MWFVLNFDRIKKKKNNFKKIHTFVMDYRCELCK